ncbi:hypothetical protein L873DRAFT_1793044 [Choiromyces venosus 120613-1]|uniref:Uncharacterized protein n=1 Tax=Choiromyces venosus 120613-1 TaxID=1336337 RepID=A0A3N4JCH0_9PEZI|nr:hypothetical protein L873DRAFT_1793044 [Choiromyces venosus 120613-1]
MPATNNQRPHFDVVAERRVPRTVMGGQFRDVNLEFEDLRLQLDEIRQELQAAEFNSLARLQNCCLARAPWAELSPLRTAQNQHVNGFPQTLGHLDRLNSESVNALLTAYGLPTEGSVPERRRRLKLFLGVVLVSVRSSN